MNFELDKRMNRRRRKSPLVVREVIHPCNDKAVTCQTFQNHNPHSGLLPCDSKSRTVGCQEHREPLQIGDHEVKPVGSLTVLEKKPLENYFGGSKGKIHPKRRTKPHKRKKSLSDFAEDVPQSQGMEMPEMCSQSSNQIMPTKEEVIKKQLEYNFYEHIKMMEYSNRKCQIQQKIMEEDYIKEQEILAETWLNYLQRRNKPKQNSHDGFSQSKSPPRKSRYFYRSKNYSSSDKVADEQHQLGKKEKKKRITSHESKSIQKQSSFDELGPAFENLVIVTTADEF